MKIKIDLDDEFVEKIVSKFCAEHIRLCNNDIAYYEERLEEKLREYEKRDLAEFVKYKTHLVGVYNYCNAKKWKD